MSVSVGGINLAEGVVDAQYRIATLEKIVEHLISKSPPGTITALEIEQYREEALQEIQKKYPQAGIQKK